MVDTSYPIVHSTDIIVRWCDMDAFGHVNNSVYFSFFEVARIEWWTKAFPAQTSFLEVGPVLINATCTFLRPIIYPAKISVDVIAGPAGRSSYECFYHIHAREDKTMRYAEGMTKVVWVDRLSGKSVPLPDYMSGLLPVSVK